MVKGGAGAVRPHRLSNLPIGQQLPGEVQGEAHRMAIRIEGRVWERNGDAGDIARLSEMGKKVAQRLFVGATCRRVRNGR